MSEIDDIEKAIEAVNKALPYLAAQHLPNLCKDIRWENKPITTKIKSNMEDNKIKFRLTSTDSKNTAKYAEKLSKAGYNVFMQGGRWYIELLYAKELFEIYQLTYDEDEFCYIQLIITSDDDYEVGVKPEIEIYDDYRE